MKTLVLLLAALALPAQAADDSSQDMTCVGPFRPMRVGYCHLLDDDIEGAEKVGACKAYRPCVMRARVVLGWTNGGRENYIVKKVYSARRPSR
jgi:hypothetical protein